MNSRARRIGVCYPLAAAIAAAACDPGAPLVRPSDAAGDPPAVRRVVVLGDSLAVSPTPAQSFPAELQRRIERDRMSWTVTNAGISGDTTAGGLRRVDALLAGDVGVLVLALGANDGLRGIPISTIEHNLSSIIERAQARQVRVLLCGMETPPASGWEYTVAFHRVFPRVASRYAVPLVPFLLAGVALMPEMNGPDRFHPNEAGAQRIAETVWPYLTPLLTMPATSALARVG